MEYVFQILDYDLDLITVGLNVFVIGQHSYIHVHFLGLYFIVCKLSGKIARVRSFAWAILVHTDSLSSLSDWRAA